MNSLKIIILGALLFLSNLSSAQLVEKWANRETGFDSIADVYSVVDPEGNLIVTTTIEDTIYGKDILTTKFDSAGGIIWQMRFNSSGTSSDYPIAIFQDDSLNTYVAGSTNGFGDDWDFLLIRYDTAGSQDWFFHNKVIGGFGVGRKDILKAVQNSDTSIYLLGCSGYRNNTWNYRLLKYSTQQRIIWDDSLNGSYNHNDIATGLAIHGNSEYILGRTLDSTDDYYDIHLVRYNEKGDLKWQTILDDSIPLSAIDDDYEASRFRECITVDNAENIFIGFNRDTMYSVAKFDSAGNLIWTETFDGRGDYEEKINALILDDSSNIYIAGLQASIDAGPDFLIAKIDSSGDLQWQFTYDCPTNKNDGATDIKLDNYGNIYATGISESISDYCDIVTMKLSPDGEQQWIKKYESRNNSYDIKTSINLFDTTTVFVSGFSRRNDHSFDQFNLAYSYDEDKSDSLNQIDEYLNTLALGLLQISKDSAIRELVYERAVLSANPKFYFVTFRELIQFGDSIGINIPDSINNILNTINESEAIDYLNPVLDSLDSIRYNVLFFIPYLTSFDSTTLRTTLPAISFMNKESFYPLPCIEHPDIDLRCSGLRINKSFVASTPTWILTHKIPENNCYDGDDGYKYVCKCLAKLDKLACKVCSVNSSLSPIGTGITGGNMMDHEVELNGEGECYNVGNPTTGINFSSTEYYSTLGQTLDANYYEKLSASQKMRKMKNALYDTDDQNNLKFGNKIDICGSGTHRLKSLEDAFLSGTPLLYDQPGISAGLYHIYTQSLPLQTLVFDFPDFPRGLWFYTNPDIRLYHYLDFPGGSCSGVQDVNEDFEVGHCDFCDDGSTLFGLGYTEKIASTDYSDMSSYWSDNVITVGICESNGVPTEYHEFIATTSPSPGSWPIQVTLTVDPNNNYECMYNFPSTLNGQDIYVWVKAKFENGEEIDEMYSFAANNTNFLTVLLRGKLRNYSANEMIYQVDIMY